MARLVDGFEPDPDEVRALVASLFHADEWRDALKLYHAATSSLAFHEAVADTLRAIRARAVQQLTATSTYEEVGELLNFANKSRVGHLVNYAKKAAAEGKLLPDFT